MVDIPSLRNEVKILAEKAVSADKIEDYDNAFTYYSKAAEKLIILENMMKINITKKYIQKKQ